VARDLALPRATARARATDAGARPFATGAMGADIDGMSVGDLRAFLKAAGADTSTCFEKARPVRRRSLSPPPLPNRATVAARLAPASPRGEPDPRAARVGRDVVHARIYRADPTRPRP